MDLTKEEKLVRKELEKLYPQLQINAQKTCGAAFEKHGHDVLMVAIEFFLKKPIEVQLKSIEEGKMENFITFIMATQLKSGSSYYYTHYRRHHEKQREFFTNYTYRDLEPVFDKPFKEEDNLVNVCIEQKIKELPPYEKMLIDELVKKEKTYTSVSKQFKIPYAHLKQDLNRVLKNLNRECQHFL